MNEPIEAHVQLSITHIEGSGPVVDSPAHVRAWLVADGMWTSEAVNGFEYDVCTVHADPVVCPSDEHTGCSEVFTKYLAKIVGVENASPVAGARCTRPDCPNAWAEHDAHDER